MFFLTQFFTPKEPPPPSPPFPFRLLREVQSVQLPFSVGTSVRLLGGEFLGFSKDFHGFHGVFWGFPWISWGFLGISMDFMGFSGLLRQLRSNQSKGKDKLIHEAASFVSSRKSVKTQQNPRLTKLATLENIPGNAYLTAESICSWMLLSVCFSCD